MKRIAALVPDVLGVGMGQGLRIELWARHLESAGWKVDFYPFEDAALHEVIHDPGNSAAKASRLLACYARRLRLVRDIPCDVLFLYREAAAFGPALLERLAIRHPFPVVYDLDDPIFVPYRGPSNGWFSLLKFPGKTKAVLRGVDHVITINRLIGDYAARYNPSVSVIPMFLDTERYTPAPAAWNGGPVRIGWIGSRTTMPNLSTIAAPLRRLQARTETELRVIGKGGVDLPGVTTEVLQWSAASEVTDLASCHIGVVPLTNLPWNKWKFNFKTIQYMAVGLPVVARGLASNLEVIEDGVNGFLVETEDEWFDRLLTLCTDPDLRRRMGEAARATVVERYSNEAQLPRVLSVFERALSRPSP